MIGGLVIGTASCKKEAVQTDNYVYDKVRFESKIARQ